MSGVDEGVEVELARYERDDITRRVGLIQHEVIYLAEYMYSTHDIMVDCLLMPLTVHRRRGRCLQLVAYRHF